MLRPMTIEQESRECVPNATDCWADRVNLLFTDRRDMAGLITLDRA